MPNSGVICPGPSFSTNVEFQPSFHYNQFMTTKIKVKTTTTTKTSAAEPASGVGKRVLVNVILDRSGSMDSIRDQTISGYNEYLRGLLADKETEYNVSLTQFDAPLAKAELTVSYVDRPLPDVPTLSRESYVPRGNTPLYDAIGETIRRIEPLQKGRPVLTLIITDGLENASREFNADTIKAFIKRKESDGWTFVFLGANIDSHRVGQQIGTHFANTANYAASNIGRTMASMASATMDYASARRSSGVMGQTAGEAFIKDEDRAKLMQEPDAEDDAKTGSKPRDWKISQ